MKEKLGHTKQKMVFEVAFESEHHDSLTRQEDDYEVYRGFHQLVLQFWITPIIFISVTRREGP
jgi:hypothetical protein